MATSVVPQAVPRVAPYAMTHVKLVAAFDFIQFGPHMLGEP